MDVLFAIGFRCSR